MHTAAVLSLLIALAGGAGVVLLRSVVHSALSLLLSLTGIAFYMLSMQADAAAWSQMTAYAGGVTVVILFGIFFTNAKEEAKDLVKKVIIGLSVLALFFIAFFFSEYFFGSSNSVQPPVSDSRTVGQSLFSQYLLVFELCAVLLTAVLAGIAEIMKAEKSNLSRKS